MALAYGAHGDRAGRLQGQNTAPRALPEAAVHLALGGLVAPDLAAFYTARLHGASLARWQHLMAIGHKETI